jgi:peptidoglycan/xylan/chitin deacetylase (PgdA/CDA1 family)
MGERADNSAKWIVRRGVKAALAGALCAAGARWVVRNVARRAAGGSRVLILSYHRPTADFAADAREALPSLLVSTGTLRMQIQQLAREREIVSMDEACRRLAAPPSPLPASGRTPDAVVLTFDDAYVGVHHDALPVLCDLRVPAVVYVPTGYVGTRRRLVHDRLFASLCELRRRRVLPQAAGLPPDVQALLDACAGDGPGSTLDALIARLPHDQLAAVTEAFEKRLGMQEEDLPEASRIMTWEELRALEAAGADVGGHTVNHAALSNLPPGRARAEIQGCKDDIAARLGVSPRHFAYPNGYYTAGVRRAVAECGFASAVTTEDVENRRGGDPFTLKRKTVWENSTLGAVSYSPSLAACNLDGVFGVLGWQHPTPGERPDVPEVEEGPERAAERQAG